MRPLVGPEQAAELRRLYDNGMSTMQVARATGFGVETVKRSLRKTGAMRKRGGGRDKVTPEEAVTLRKLYNAGASAAEIANKTGYADSTVRRSLKKTGPMRNTGDPHAVTPEVAARFVKLYNGGASIVQIAQQTGYGATSIRRWLIDSGDSQHVRETTCGFEKVTEATAVSQIGLPPRVWHLLRRRCIFTLGDLVRYSASELVELSYIPGKIRYRVLGPMRLAWLIECLRRHGFELAQDSEQ